MVHRRVSGPWAAVGVLLAASGLCCAGPDAEPTRLVADTPLHLEDHLETADITGSKVPAEVPEPIEWRFEDGRDGWKSFEHFQPQIPILDVEHRDGTLRISLDDRHTDPRQDRLHGDVYVDLPNLTRAEWSHVVVEARATAGMRRATICFNLASPDQVEEDDGPSLFWGDRATIVNDGTVQRYRMRADYHWSEAEWADPWTQLLISIDAGEPATLEILSIQLVPKAAVFASEAFGVRSVAIGDARRRALFTHTPVRIDLPVAVPEGARLDTALGVIREDLPVDFGVTIQPEGEDAVKIFEESYGDQNEWGQRSIDLNRYAGRPATLTLEATTEEPEQVALWGAPTLTGSNPPAPGRPNVIFYVLDGGGADYMSVYGYNRRTTPNLERLAAQGVVFENAYSNSSWSKTSTTSFMTSLQNSVLGNYRDRFDPLPVEATTMAERFHAVGYQTAVFTSNAWAGAMSSLDRGVDVMRDAGVDNDTISSTELHADYWAWREAHPGQPYWVHFQTTDPHEEYNPVPPFQGMFVSPEEEQTWRDWDEQLEEFGDHDAYSEAWEKTGLDRQAFYALQQGMYDQALAHNDHQIGRMIDRLQALGEWENTLFIVAADHSTWAAMDDMGLAIQTELPPEWSSPMFRPSISRVPLIMSWPRRIPAGRRIAEPVSMIDVLPTVLELAGLPPAKISQGQSLAPLIDGVSGWNPRPVILDQFQIDHRDGELRGLLEMIEGRWGASLWIGPRPTVFWHLLPFPDTEDEERPEGLLLYDLWSDPLALEPVNEEHPDLVEHYTRLLQRQWKAHQDLATQFTPSEATELTPEQLETLRSLGYIQ